MRERQLHEKLPAQFVGHAVARGLPHHVGKDGHPVLSATEPPQPGEEAAAAPRFGEGAPDVTVDQRT